MTETAAPAVLKVDVWSDVACPWCYIGKRRFDTGVQQYAAAGGGLPVAVEYHSFELVPDAPVDFDGDELDFLTGRYQLPRERAQDMVDRVAATAASVGLDYHVEGVRHTNTRKAHELLHLAKAEGVQAAVKDRLLRAYFVEGRHLGRPQELADLAAEVGLSAERVLTALADGTYAPDVEADVELAAAVGVTGVPFYVFDDRYAVSGAREPELFAAVLARVETEAGAGTEAEAGVGSGTEAGGAPA